MWRRDYHAGTLGRNVARAIGGRASPCLVLYDPVITPDIGLARPSFATGNLPLNLPVQFQIVVFAFIAAFVLFQL